MKKNKSLCLQTGGINKLMLVLLLGIVGSGVYYAKSKGLINSGKISALGHKISRVMSGGGTHSTDGFAGYGVQILATSELNQAKNVMDNFAGDGYSAFVLASKSKGRTWYKVRLGPYQHKPEADAIKDKVKRRYPRSPYLQSSFVIYKP